MYASAGRGAAAEHVQRQHHVRAEHDLGLLAHGRRRHHRRRPASSSRTTTSRSRYVFTETVNATGYGRRERRFGQLVFWLRLRTRPADGPVHDHRLRRLGTHVAEETQDASRAAAVGMYMSVVVSVVFGFILLVAVTFAAPEHGAAQLDNSATSSRRIWAASMSQNWAEFLLFICVRRAVLLRDGLRDVGLADDVRVLPRPRRAGAPALAPGRAAIASRARSVIGIGVLRRGAHDPGDLRTTSSATRSAPRSR